ncbi:hypothetical protein RIF29_26412 [Crotalaria pallida]|uniref:Uncharacterized protein n=1 Tax=Crotalaria pallida TaxID=3830 RepID=A0AAN9ENN7_CROPI
MQSHAIAADGANQPLTVTLYDVAERKNLEGSSTESRVGVGANTTTRGRATKGSAEGAAGSGVVGDESALGVSELCEVCLEDGGGDIYGDEGIGSSSSVGTGISSSSAPSSSDGRSSWSSGRTASRGGHGKESI